jgi:amino acid permease
VGAGVLGLPYAFSYLGFVGGSFLLLLAGGSALYTSWLLASMHEMNSVRHNRYRDLGAAIMGRKWSNIFIAPFQFTVMVRKFPFISSHVGQTCTG